MINNEVTFGSSQQLLASFGNHVLRQFLFASSLLAFGPAVVNFIGMLLGTYLLCDILGCK